MKSNKNLKSNQEPLLCKECNSVICIIAENYPYCNMTCEYNSVGKRAIAAGKLYMEEDYEISEIQ